MLPVMQLPYHIVKAARQQLILYFGSMLLLRILQRLMEHQRLRRPILRIMRIQPLILLNVVTGRSLVRWVTKLDLILAGALNGNGQLSLWRHHLYRFSLFL